MRRSQGASKSHIIVAIIDREPTPITHFVPEVPEALELIITEALAKDVEERCQTAKEMLGKLRRLKQRMESGAMPPSISEFNTFSLRHTRRSLASEDAKLQEAARSTVPSGDLADTRALSSVESSWSKRRKKVTVAAVVIGLIVVSAISFGLFKLFSQPKQFGPIKMTALTTGGKVNEEDIRGQLTISPDGKYVVCAAGDAKQRASLWLRQVSTNSLVRIVPPENGVFLATTFSPDGEMVYYVAMLERNKFVPTLYRIPVLGGTPTKVLDRVFGAVGFSQDGKQFAFVRRNQEDMALMVANTDGSGQPRTIAVSKQPNGFSTSGPSWSPDGKRIACGMINATGGGNSTVVEVSVDGGDPQPIGSEKWASVGRVIWLADNSGLIITAQPEFSSTGTQVWFLPY